MEIRFGDCAIDRARRLVMRRGEPVHVSPKAFELLEILIDAKPRVVARSALSQRLWPQTYVVEANLSNLVAEIRAAIGDSARQPRWLRTVHNFGYGLDTEPSTDKADLAREEPASCFWLVHREGRVCLREGDHLIGRHPRSVVAIDSSLVSRRHARITVSKAHAVLTDLGSRNGTYIDKYEVQGRAILHDRDCIQVGDILLEFRITDLRDPTDEMKGR